MADGSIIIDTKIDNSGLKKGLDKATTSAKSQAAKLAAEYKKQGMSASEAFKKAWAEIERDSGIQANKTASNWEYSTNKINDIAKKGLKAFTGAVVAAGTALTGVGIAGTKLASDLEEVQNVVDVTFGDNASVINDWAKAAKEAFGMSELDAKKFNGTMGAMLKSMGLNSEEVLNMSQNMVGLAGDFASFYNLGHEEAFDKIRAGISGETEPLKQLGINMSVANLEAYALSEGITKAYKDMTQAEQATLRYNYLLSASADAQGDFARTSDSLANQLRIAKLNMQELGSEIGQMLMPVAQEAAEIFNELGGQLRDALSSPEMQESIQKITEGLGTLIENIAELISDWLPKIIEGFAWLVDNGEQLSGIILSIGSAWATWNVLSGIANILPVVAGFASKLFLELATAPTIMAGVSGAISMLGGPITLIIGAVSALVAGIIYLWNTNEGFREEIINAWNAIKEVGISVWEWLVNFFTVDIPNAWNTVVEFFQGIPDWFAELWAKVTAKFKEWGTNISNFFTETIPQWIENITNWFNELPYKIGYALGYVLATIAQWGVNTWNYFTTNIPIWIESITNWFSELPGRIWTWLVETYNKVVAWGTDMYSKAIESAKNFIDGVISWIKELPGKFSTWLNETINKIVNFASNAYNKAREAGKNIVDGIVNTIKNLPSQIYDIGVNIVEGLWNGITSMGSWISNKVSSFFSGIVDGAKEVLGIHSPSRVLRDQVGKYMAQGVGEGFEVETDNVRKSIESDLSYLVSKMSATVDYETAMTTARVVTYNNVLSGGVEEKDIGPKDNPVTVVAKLIVDGKEFTQTVVAPNQDVLTEYYEGRLP